MGQGQSGDNDWPAEGVQDGVSPSSTGPRVVERMLPAPPDSNATGAYLARLIAQAEEQGPLSHHDLELLRFQLNTIRKEVSRRARDQPSTTRPPASSSQPQAPAHAASFAVSSPSPSPVVPLKRLKIHSSSSDDSSQPTDDPIALIGQHQAQIHAANMEMIRQAQMHYQLYQQPGSSQPWHSVPQPQPSRPLPSPIAPADWSMGASPNPASIFSPHDRQYSEALGMEISTPPWSPFAEEPKADSASQPSPDYLLPSSTPLHVDTAERPTPVSEPRAEIATAFGCPPGRGTPSSTAGFERSSRAERSKLFLNNYLNMSPATGDDNPSSLLETLEREYLAGNFSSSGLRQCLMTSLVILEPDDQEELMNSFSKMNLSGSEHALATCPHVDIQPTPGVPCCPQHSGVGSRANTFRRAQAELESRLTASPVPLGVPFAEAMASIMVGDRELAESLSAALAQDISPGEAAPDDEDGVARMRFNIIFSMPTPSIRNKRKKSSSGDTTADDSLITSSSTSPHAVADQVPLRVYRCVQVNKAFEDYTGMTQASLCRDIIILAKPAGMFEGLRSDHIRAAHLINTRWRLDNTLEGHMYQVRRHIDGSIVYSLLHVKHRVEHGVTLGVEHALIPLPVDETHPLPPFVEGVDLDVDTLLYGYKPPQST